MGTEKLWILGRCSLIAQHTDAHRGPPWPVERGPEPSNVSEGNCRNCSALFVAVRYRWDALPPLTADCPHFFQRYGRPAIGATPQIAQQQGFPELVAHGHRYSGRQAVVAAVKQDPGSLHLLAARFQRYHMPLSRSCDVRFTIE